MNIICMWLVGTVNLNIICFSRESNQQVFTKENFLLYVLSILFQEIVTAVHTYFYCYLIFS